MSKNQFCISKKFFFSFAFLLIALSSLFLINHLNKNKQITKTGAAPPRIIGGHLADPGEWPFMVALYDKSKEKTIKESFFCGGSLISNQWILTAGHCAKYFENRPQDIKAIININYLDDKKIPEKTFEVEKPLIHESYINVENSYYKNDIALIKLKKTIKISFVAINNDLGLIKKDIKGYAMGWGNINPNNELLEIDLTLDLYPKSATFYENTIFAYKGKEERPSYGDSGGPFVIWYKNKYYLAGIISHLKNNFPNNSHSRGINLTTVAKYTDWIKNKTGIDIDSNNKKSFIGNPPDWITPTIIPTSTPNLRRR